MMQMPIKATFVREISDYHLLMGNHGKIKQRSCMPSILRNLGITVPVMPLFFMLLSDLVCQLVEHDVRGNQIVKSSAF